jgi:putative transposase
MNSDEKEILEQHGCYYLTLSVTDCTDIFIRPVHKQIIVESLNYFIEKKGLIVYAWCLMTNHLHLLAQARQGFGLSSIISEFKKFTGRIILEDIDVEPEVRKKWMLERFENASRQLKLAEKYQVWENYNHPVYLDTLAPLQIRETLDRIHNNPVRDRIVLSPDEYLHSSARDYCGMKGIVNIKMLQQTTAIESIVRHISSYRYMVH